MQVVDIREEWVQGTKRSVATVIWEHHSRTQQDIFVGVEGTSSDMLRGEANAFLVGALWPAMYHFEKRILVEGSLCPLLVENLHKAMSLFHRWYKDARPIEIEGDVASEPFEPAADGRSALMFSGGLDSLASLRVNRDTHSEGDPDWFEYGLVVEAGFDAFDTSPRGAYWPEMEAMATDVGLELVPVSTNLRELEPADHFFGRYLHGALLATVGHSLTGRLRSVAIASTDPDTSFPWGSHPDLDPLYSSGALAVIHDLPTMNRYQKTALIADWPVIRNRLKVCYVADRLPSGKWNCCECEKCLRTMLSLVALGKLDEFEAFNGSKLTPESVERGLHMDAQSMRYYQPIIRGLEQSGHERLAAIVSEKYDEGSERQRRSPAGRFREFDRKRLGGAIRRTKRRVFG
jgi:hypothetical protein